MNELDWIGAQRVATAKAVAAAESPAEAAMALHLLAHKTGATYLVGAPGSGAEWVLTMQREVRAAGQTYRIDIAMGKGPLRLAVEVDGWAYHHVTDEQQRRDAAKDRALRAAGWEVLRIDAWRIFKAPGDCVSEICSRLQQIEWLANRLVPVEEDTEEGVRARIEALEDAVKECEKASWAEGAEENRRKIARILACRKRAETIAREMGQDEETLLRSLFTRRAERLGVT